MSTLLRLAEDLERSRDQLVREAHVGLEAGRVRVGLVTDSDARVARWAAGRKGDLFERPFGPALEVA